MYRLRIFPRLVIRSKSLELRKRASMGVFEGEYERSMNEKNRRRRHRRRASRVSQFVATGRLI